jgi:2-deoxy-D-gluconate 3-dehydrogenase
LSTASPDPVPDWAASQPLLGKTAVVTGCKRGIGRAMSLALAQAGADVIGVSATLEADGEEVGQDVVGTGRQFTGYACDLGDRAALHALVAMLQRDHDGVDILVNNAGTIMRRPAAEHPDEMWDHVIEVNLSAQFVLARELGRGMVQRGAGKIIFTASLLSFQGGINVPGYAASKGGVMQLTKALANEWAGRGVNVNAIAPGYVRTDNTQALQDDEQRSEEILRRIPAGRWASPGDFAGPIVFLASAASEYIHGHVLTVDGGWMGR